MTHTQTQVQACAPEQIHTQSPLPMVANQRCLCLPPFVLYQEDNGLNSEIFLGR